MPYKLILLRHGRSEWNAQNRFTGWVDVPLDAQGVTEARRAGALLAQHACLPDTVHTSLLRRANDTATLALAGCGRADLPLHRAWELNERHYGALQGQDKAEAAAEFGAEQVHLWRRSYDVRPPPMSAAEAAAPENDPEGMYAAAGIAVPRTECLKDVLARVEPYWERAIVPELRQGKTVLVAAHGNSLRALVKRLEGISDAEIPELEIPTGVPIVYELEEGSLRVVSNGGKGVQLT